jgi:hypothetical protein
MTSICCTERSTSQQTAIFAWSAQKLDKVMATVVTEFKTRIQQVPRLANQDKTKQNNLKYFYGYHCTVEDIEK